MNKKALIVDDDPVVRMILKSILEAEGYVVELAEDGMQGLEVVKKKQNELDVVFLDVMMPQMNGFEVIEKLKNQEKIEGLPVIMLTAQNDDSELLKGYSLGADYYITKPFTRSQITYGLKTVGVKND
ncbi:MAG TPA: response regulator [Oligoflexia bacterium]|nr:response regulator [Oligoflexia bacterium]HMP27765.1 response regulator [Oligoflexia bacterium]